ncbi:uncharacterized protein LOC110025482 isoform X2 [Phalaenopsis equestris]|uniref:uncharacterized protein LOC110025482 isoform X2 n=1 Tax=Phalaenopsis equestris TaxID=78828 RepID=UPI0009E54219|nr:uncharacterized protein LOC110025482 isoform X2 [Phalaenopsis equestris]
MMIRTYSRRNRCDSRSFSETPRFDSDYGGSEDADLRELSLSQDSHQDRRHGLAVTLSSQESSPWSLDPDLLSLSLRENEDPLDDEETERRTEKKGRKQKRGCIDDLKGQEPAAAMSETSTLLETQEFGEMMEHVDEVNFSLDGLQPWQPARIRRASLLSLLSICSVAQRRRLLRARGMADKIINAILDLNFDDSPSTIGAAALFFIMASDVEDERLLESPACLRFLLMLLNPPISHSVEKKPQKGRFNLLDRHKPQTLDSASKGVDSSSRAIISKVKEILVNCNEIKSGNENDDGMKRPEFSSKWIALLIMEKACLSTVSFAGATETIRKVGGNFKESLRELKGLDAIFEVVTDCHSTLEGLFRKKLSSVTDSKDDDSAALESVVFLLKCLKVMENATFLSKNNQNYLLSKKAKLESGRTSLSFVGIIISCIKFLSGLSLLQNPFSTSNYGKLTCLPNGASEVCSKGKNTDVQDYSSTSFCGTKSSQMESIEVCHKRQKLSTASLEATTSLDALPAMDRADCLTSTSYDTSFNSSNGLSCTSTIGLEVKLHPNGMKANSQSSSGWISIRSTGSKESSHVQSKRMQMSSHCKADSASEFCDPFEFDDHLGPSKWEQLSSKKGKTQTSTQAFAVTENVNGSEALSIIINDESSQPTIEVNPKSSDNSCPSAAEEDPNILEDCLLSSVLMNLTNDNPVGCQQIGACGGLDTLASLIANHFPSFDLCFPVGTETEEIMTSIDRSNECGHLNDRKMHDHQLDFLVAILGLLVNLVEKDSPNRLRLASARVLVNQPGTSASKEIYREVVPLLCSIFLSNQRAGNAAGEEEALVNDDEASLLQSQREAEMMIIEAYAALLLAFLSTESTKVKEAIARCLPNHRLQILVPVLERFVAFHLTLNMISPETHSAVVKVIESCKES